MAGRIGARRPGNPKSETAPTAQSRRAPPTSRKRWRWVARGSHSASRKNQAPAARESVDVGVRSTLWSAGKRVKTTIQVKKSPTATQTPISRIGRMLETESAANPTRVAKIDAVHATNLFSRAKTWCSSSDRPAGRSTKRECR